MFYYWINDDFSFLFISPFFSPPQRRYTAAQQSATRNIRRERRQHERNVYLVNMKREKGKRIGREDRSFSSYFHSSSAASPHVWMMSFPIDFPSFVMDLSSSYTSRFRGFSLSRPRMKTKLAIYSLSSRILPNDDGTRLDEDNLMSSTVCGRIEF
jgi:hypothetical protein